MTREQAARTFAQSIYDAQREQGDWLHRRWLFEDILQGFAYGVALFITDDPEHGPFSVDMAIAEAICEAVAAC